MSQQRLSDETLQWIFESSTWIVMGLEPGPSTVGRIPLEEVDEAIREMACELLERRQKERAREVPVEPIALASTPSRDMEIQTEQIVISGTYEQLVAEFKAALDTLKESPSERTILEVVALYTKEPGPNT